VVTRQIVLAALVLLASGVAGGTAEAQSTALTFSNLVVVDPSPSAAAGSTVVSGKVAGGGIANGTQIELTITMKNLTTGNSSTTTVSVAFSSATATFSTDVDVPAVALGVKGTMTVTATNNTRFTGSGSDSFEYADE
jgi:hypothetical protein